MDAEWMTDVLPVFQAFVFIVSKRFRFEFYFPVFRCFPHFHASVPHSGHTHSIICSLISSSSPHTYPILSPLPPQLLTFPALPTSDEPTARFVEFKVLIREDHTSMFSEHPSVWACARAAMFSCLQVRVITNLHWISEDLL